MIRGSRWVPPSISGTPKRRSVKPSREPSVGYPQVAPQRQLEPAGQAPAADRGDGRLRRREPGEPQRPVGQPQPRRERLDRLQVGARAERLAARAGEHQHARLVVGLEPAVGLGQQVGGRARRPRCGAPGGRSSPAPPRRAARRSPVRSRSPSRGILPETRTAPEGPGAARWEGSAPPMLAGARTPDVTFLRIRAGIAMREGVSAEDAPSDAYYVRERGRTMAGASTRPQLPADAWTCRSAALRASLRFSSRPWTQEPKHTTRKKKITTPSEKKVMMLSFGLADEPLAVVVGEGRDGQRQREDQGQEGECARLHRRRSYRVVSPDRERRRLQLHHRDPEGEPEQVRVGPRARAPGPGPVPVLVGRLSDRLRVHPRHAQPGRRPAGRHVLRVGGHVPGLHDRREADRAVPDGGRPGHRRQGAVRAAARTRAGTRWRSSRTCRSC